MLGYCSLAPHHFSEKICSGRTPPATPEGDLLPELLGIEWLEIVRGTV